MRTQTQALILSIDAKSMTDREPHSIQVQSTRSQLVLLSVRELQVLELVASGLTNQDIAENLDISKRTVDNHISNILTKTETDNRVSLVRWALQWGKVCLDQVNCCTLPPVNPVQ